MNARDGLAGSPRAATPLAPGCAIPAVEPLEPRWLLNGGELIFGLDFGPYMVGQRPPDHLAEGQIAERLKLIAPYTEWVHTYGAASGLEKVPYIADVLGLSVAMGVYIDGNDATNQQEIANLLAAAQDGRVDIAVIGNEAIQHAPAAERAAVAEDIRGYLLQVRGALDAAGLTDIPVTYADAYGWLFDGVDGANPRYEDLTYQAVLDACDVVFVSYYPFWEGTSIDEAMGQLDGWHQVVRAVIDQDDPTKEVYVAETGWPDAGETHGQAVPSAQNAARYFSEFTTWARQNDVPYFYFEAFDEGWKQEYQGVGPHWGLWDEGGELKPQMAGLLQRAEPVVDIQLTYVPPQGSFNRLKGYVRGVRAATHRVINYIRVDGGWWSKPTFAAPRTAISANGAWTNRIVTGGVDWRATEIISFLMPSAYWPPLAAGDAELPMELYERSLSIAGATRRPDLTGRIEEVRLPAPAVPGDRGTAAVLVTNEGDTVSRGYVRINLFASPDAEYSLDDVLVGSILDRACTLRQGQSKRYNVRLRLPPDLPPGEHYLVAEVDAFDDVRESREDNNVAVRGEPIDVVWWFGSFDGRRNVRLTVNDDTGRTVTFALAGGWGEVAGGSSFSQVVLHETGVRSAFSIATRGRTETAVGDIEVHGSLGRIRAATTHLGGNLTVHGLAGAAQLGDLDGGHVIAINADGLPVGQRDKVTLRFARVADAAVETHGLPIASLTAVEWLDDDGLDNDTVAAPWIGRVSITGSRRRGDLSAGDFQADLALDGEGVAPGRPTLGSARIAGDLAGASWAVAGDVRTLSVGGWARNCAVAAEGDIRSLTLGAAEASSFFAGIDLGILGVQDHAETAADFADDQAVLASLRIRGWRLPAGDDTRFVTGACFSAPAFGTVSLVNAEAFDLYVLGDEAAIRSVRHRDTLDRQANWYWRPGRLWPVPGALNVIGS